MKYTYRYDIQGNGDSHYLHMYFDRPLAASSFYRHNDDVSPKDRELSDAIAHTPNVLCNDQFAGTGELSGASAELIHVDGTALTVKIVPHRNVPEIAKQIVKKVQRRLAPKESRRRVLKATLDAYVKRLNERTYGKPRNT